MRYPADPEFDAKVLSQFRAARPAPRRPVTPGSIADVILARVAATGCCTDADLSAAGFTAAELASHGEAARALCRRRQLEEAA